MTKWRHSVCTKVSQESILAKKREAIGKILRQLCEWKGVGIVEAEVCADHIHMLEEIPPKIAASGFMGYLNGKSGTMLYGQFDELKYKYRSSACGTWSRMVPSPGPSGRRGRSGPPGCSPRPSRSAGLSHRPGYLGRSILTSGIWCSTRRQAASRSCMPSISR